jgi:hypothetical protein
MVQECIIYHLLPTNKQLTQHALVDQWGSSGGLQS